MFACVKLIKKLKGVFILKTQNKKQVKTSNSATTNTKKVASVKKVGNHQTYKRSFYGDIDLFDRARGRDRNLIKKLVSFNGKFSDLVLSSIQKKVAILKKVESHIKSDTQQRMLTKNDESAKTVLTSHLKNMYDKSPTQREGDKLLNDNDLYTKKVETVKNENGENEQVTTYQVNKITDKVFDKVLNIAIKQRMSYLNDNVKHK